MHLEAPTAIDDVCLCKEPVHHRRHSDIWKPPMTSSTAAWAFYGTLIVLHTSFVHTLAPSDSSCVFIIFDRFVCLVHRSGVAQHITWCLRVWHGISSTDRSGRGQSRILRHFRIRVIGAMNVELYTGVCPCAFCYFGLACASPMGDHTRRCFVYSTLCLLRCDFDFDFPMKYQIWPKDYSSFIWKVKSWWIAKDVSTHFRT